MKKESRYLMLPLAAATMALLSGCSSMGNLLGQSQPVLSPAAKAAADRPLEKEAVVDTQDTYLALVKQMQSKSLWYASIAHLDALDKQWGASSDSRLLRADALRQVGQLSAAIPIYQGLLGSAKDGAARYGLGRVAAEQGDFRSAALQMEQARMSNPVDSRLLTDLGYAYLRARDLNAARIPLMQAAQLNPEDAQASVNLSLFMMVSGQSAQAEEFMRQRKLDAQTQQLVKEQAGEWLRTASLAAAKPAAAATGKVVNLSRPEVKTAPEAVASSGKSAEVPEPAAAQEVPTAKKPAPEPEAAKAPVVVVKAAESVQPPAQTSQSPLPLPAAAPMMARNVERGPSGGQWMVSGGSFDAGRPRHPGQGASQLMPAAPQTYAYAPPVPVQTIDAPVDVAAAASLEMTLVPKQSEMAVNKAQLVPALIAKTAPPLEATVATASQSFRQEAGKAAQPLFNEAMPAKLQQAQPAQATRAESAPQPVISRQPVRPTRSVPDAAVVMAAAYPAAVRQSGESGSKQAVQALLPQRAAAGGLFFETPDEDAGSKPVASAKKSAPERAWP
ncbi:tetratricopeptide repeat protein [Comamonas thiooxydans]|uniref:tetratricopeptide repeat protein n=1 Tax=Comamonas TaxID=283 RepID=UPI001CD02528|nr:tetratricopeptide repeat protein [Comamonas thiooxydans]MCO8248225.1 tetratricopeptide repeat protein [Comamonas thiooxydans]UBQ41621.1 tetratricopeptide repeat protein [Comamonas thiooxydans]